MTMTELNSKKIDLLVAIYEQLISLMKNVGDTRLIVLVEAAIKSLEQLKQIRAVPTDDKTTRAMLTGLKQGLREMPKLLASIVPDSHLKLVPEFEKSLGKKFSDF